MKNPFKDIRAKIKAKLDKLKMPDEKKAELRKSIVDSFGDSCFVGGITLVGAAIFAPVATGPTLAFAAIFLAAGTTAKYTAAHMKPNGPELEKAIPAPPEKPDEKPAVEQKPASPEFTRAIKRTAESQGDKPSPKRGPSPPHA
jgi:hypothetical protein